MILQLSWRNGDNTQNSHKDQSAQAHLKRIHFHAPLKAIQSVIGRASRRTLSTCPYHTITVSTFATLHLRWHNNTTRLDQSITSTQHGILLSEENVEEVDDVILASVAQQSFEEFVSVFSFPEELGQKCISRQGNYNQPRLGSRSWPC